MQSSISAIFAKRKIDKIINGYIHMYKVLYFNTFDVIHKLTVHKHRALCCWYRAASFRENNRRLKGYWVMCWPAIKIIIFNRSIILTGVNILIYYTICIKYCEKTSLIKRAKKCICTYFKSNYYFSGTLTYVLLIRIYVKKHSSCINF